MSGGSGWSGGAGGRPAGGSATRAFAAGSAPGSPNGAQGPDPTQSDQPTGAGAAPQQADAAAAYAAAAARATAGDDAEGAEVAVDPGAGSAPPAPDAEARATGEEGAAAPDPQQTTADGLDGTSVLPADSLAGVTASDLEQLAAQAVKANEYLALAQRTQADFENFRKRATRDAAVAQERGIAKLAKELLPAIDNLDRAVQALETFPVAGLDEGAAEAESQLASGIKLVQAEIMAALARVGIEPYSPAGEVFDPQHHEAVAQAPIEGATPGTVTEVYQRGYRLGETVLRPARVLVAA